MDKLSCEPEDVQREAMRLWAAHNSRQGQLCHGIRRLAVRCVRIGCGFLGVAFAYSIVLHAAPTAQKPLSSLSLADIAMLLCHIGAVLIGSSASFMVAFGEYRCPAGPSAFILTARQNVEAQVVVVREEEIVS